MKNIRSYLLLSLIVAAVCAGVVFAGEGNDFDQPHFEQITRSVEELKNQSMKGFSFDPVLEVNPNRGSFTTHIPIDLPPNLAGYSGLKLNYTSQTGENLGLGKGWRWNLPFIRRNNKPSGRAPFLTAGVIGVTELTPTGEDTSVIRAFAQSALTDAQFFEAFRPLVDETFTLFLRGINSSGSICGWVAIKTDGTRWTFTSEGLPTFFADKHGNSLVFQWSEGLLKSISEKRGGESAWQAQVSYTSQKEKLPAWTPQGWFTLPLGLEKIVISDRVLHFSYDADGFLLSAGWQGGLTPLFQGRYSSPDRSIESKSNAFKKHDDQIPYRLDPGTELQGMKTDHNPDFLEYYVDLNGDGRTDRVRFDRRRDKINFNRIWGVCNENDGLAYRDKVNDALKVLNDRIDGTVEYAVQNNSTQITAWTEDPSLKIPEQINPYLNQADVEDESRKIVDLSGIHDASSCHQFSSIPRAIFFVDLNGDGRKDLVDCGYDDQTNAQYSEVDNDQITLANPSGKAYQVKRRHSNLALSALTLTRPDLTAGKTFSNSFSLPGKPASIYLQSTQDTVLDQWLKETQGKYGPGVSFMTGVSQWQPVSSSAGFSCHRGSLFFDANHDGHLDVLTGNTLYLGSDQPGKYLAVQVNPKDFLEVDTDPIDLTDTQILVADVDGTGQLKIRQARSLEYDPSSGKYELVRNGTTDLITPAPLAGKLLSEVISPYGGEIHIQYRYAQGVWVVDSIQKEPKGIQPSLLTSYQYQGSLNDPFRGVFIGFSNTTEKAASSDARAGSKEIQRLYYQDLDPAASLFSSRARINGRLMLMRELDPTRPIGSDRTLNETTYSPMAVSLGNHRILPFDSETQEFLYHLGGRNVMDQKVSKLFMPSDDENWAKDSLGNRILPLRTTVEETGMGIPSAQGDSLLDTKQTILKGKKYVPNLNLFLPLYRQTRDKDNLQYRADLQVEYEGDLFNPSRFCEAERCQSFQFDPQGRLTEVRSSQGRVEQAEYAGLFPFPEKWISNEGTETRHYDPLTGLLMDLTLPTGALFHRNYTPDGVLFRVTGQESSVSQPKTFLELFGGNPQSCEIGAELCQVDNTLNAVYLDTFQILHLDGFGRIESSTTQLEKGRVLNNGTTFYGENDQVLARSRPQWGSGDSGVLSYEAKYDSFGRMVWEHDGVVGSPSTGVRTYDYEGGCRTETLNAVMRQSTCTNLFGNIESQALGSEEITFSTTAQGDLLALPSLGMTWKPDLHSEVIESMASPERGLQWLLSKRLVESLSNGRRFTDGTGFSRFFNSSGQLAEAQKRMDFGAQVQPTDTDEKRTYQAGLLSHRSLVLLSTPETPFLSQSYSYSGFGGLTGWSFGNFQLTIPQDIFGRPVGWKGLGSSSEKSADFTYVYSGGKIKSVLQAHAGSLSPLLSFVRDELGRIIEVDYENGLKVFREYRDLTDRIRSIRVSSKTETLWSENLTESPDRQQVIGRDLSMAPSSASLKEVFEYDPSTYQLRVNTQKNSSDDFDRRDTGKVTRIGNDPILWSGDFLAQVGGRSLFYDGVGSWVASCPQGQSPSSGLEHCIVKTGGDTYFYEGMPVALIRVDGLAVGVWVDGLFYPVVTDYLGSLRAQFSPSGDALLWARTFGAWGEKKVFAANVEAQALEKKTLWSFAHLMEQPGVESAEGFPLYWSQTRVYSSAIHEWLSVDPAVKWEPGKLIHKPGNWNAVRYANNQPLNYIDPTGEDVVRVGLSIGGHAGPVGGSVSFGFAGGYSTEAGVSGGVYGGFSAGTGVGLEAGANVQLGYSSDSAVKAGSSYSQSSGIHVAEMGDVSVEAGQSVDSKTGERSFGSTLNLGVGLGASVTNYVGKEWTLGTGSDDPKEKDGRETKNTHVVNDVDRSFGNSNDRSSGDREGGKSDGVFSDKNSCSKDDDDSKF